MWPGFVAIVAALFLAPPAEAQKQCRKGIPCGNTCIAATKTCRVGSGEATPATTASPRAETAVPTPAPDTVSVPAPWIASSRGSTYYRNGCTGARRLSPANRIFFATEEEAQRAGYRRSRTEGC